MLVHVSSAYVPVDVTFHENLHHISGALDHKRGEVLDVHPGILIT